MEKKEPHPEKRPHLEDSFSTVGFFNRLICTRDANKQKKGQGRDSNPKFRDHSTACYHYTTLSLFFLKTPSAGLELATLGSRVQLSTC